MRKFVFLALLVFIYYIAGMYESAALMVLFLTQLFLAAAMLPLAVYLNRRLSVSFPESFIRAEQHCPFSWRLRTSNKARLPVSRFELRILDGSGKRRVCGSCAPGEAALVFESVYEHCGVFAIRARRLRVYDYLCLFSGKQRLSMELRAAVFPPEYAMRIQKPSALENAQSYQKSLYRNTGDSGEIRQIREYRDGDQVRFIHWNQTARTGTLWVKEFEEEQNGRDLLYLQRSPGLSSEAYDAYCTLILALILGLLQDGSSVRVRWREADPPQVREFCVTEKAQCTELLLLFYQAGDPVSEDVPCDAAEGMMRLTPELAWYQGSSLIWQFSAERLKEELSQRMFIFG